MNFLQIKLVPAINLIPKSIFFKLVSLVFLISGLGLKY
jgi:hypothetical protein